MVLPEKIEELILNGLADDILPEEKEYLKNWLSEAVENRNLYGDYCKLWYSGKLGEQRRCSRNEILWIKIKQLHLRRKYLRVVYRMGMVAACMLLFLGGYYFWNQRRTVETKIQTVADLLASRRPEAVKLILSSGREVQLNNRLTEQEAGAFIQSDSTGLRYQDLGQLIETEEIVYNKLVVPKCGEYRLILSDGTKIMMNAESDLRYPVTFNSSIREVWLSGEAYFEVSHVAECPFIVHLEHTSVKVLGTSFNIMAYRNEKHMEITLVEGSVDVSASGRHELLTPGHQMLVDNSTLHMEKRKVDANLYTAWKDGILRFDDLPLEQLMKRLSRWYNIQFDFQQDDLKKKLFTGGFKKYENIENVLEMIQETNDVKFKVQNNEIIIESK